MRQHPRPTYGKARGQWPPQLDKGDSSAQFHGQMESARRLSLTVEFSAPLRCVWQRVSLAREIFFMQGMKNGTECTLSRENETLPGAKPDSERNRYDPCTTERRRRPCRPPKRAGREKGGAKNTDLPSRRSAWYIYMVVQDSRTRRARPLQLCPTQCNSPGSRRGGTDIPPRLQPTFSWAYPQWRTFVPAVFTASVHPCVHSAGRVGFGYPVPFSPLPAPSERYRQRLHWINRSLIVLCAPVLAATQNQVHIIIVLPELVNPQPLLSAACMRPLLLLLFQLLAHLFHDLHAQRGTGSQQRCTGQKFLLLHNGILPLHICP